MCLNLEFQLINPSLDTDTSQIWKIQRLLNIIQVQYFKNKLFKKGGLRGIEMSVKPRKLNYSIICDITVKYIPWFPIIF